MAISVNVVKCPSCGANLPVEDGREKIFCSFCGTPIIITNENEYIYRHIDEAGIKQAETDRVVELKKLEIIERKRAEVEKRKSLKMKLSIALGVAAIIFILIGYVGEAYGFIMPGMVCAIILLYMWLAGMDSKDEDDDIYLGEKVRIPAGVDEYNNKNYRSIEAEFRGAGFNNIQCIPLRDLTTGFLKKPNMVESITINGEDIDDFDSREKVSSNASVIISYHSFS